MFHRYMITWDVKKVLSFLATWHPATSLSLKDLTLKCVALVAITSSDRAQTIQLMDIENNDMNNKGIFFPIYALLKHSKKNRPVTVVKCVKFTDHPPLDVCDYISSYMQRTLKFRIREVSLGFPKPTQLFLSYSTGKPLRRASISKYILDVLSLAGINTSCFKSHTTRGVLPSQMMKRGSSPGQILAQGDWKHLGTFKKYYDRHSDTSIEGRLIRKVTGR